MLNASSLPILRATPDVIRAQLQNLPDDAVRTNYGPETFSPFDILGHLVWGDLTDWVSRAQHILEHGDTKPFVPFDRYAMYERDKSKSVRELLDEFRATRDEKLEELNSLKLDEDARLDLRGLHPEFGPCTMANLMATWVTHDLHHIAQICKAIARSQYASKAGPWKAYLGILTK